jgi:hypothetical protein
VSGGLATLRRVFLPPNGLGTVSGLAGLASSVRPPPGSVEFHTSGLACPWPQEFLQRLRRVASDARSARDQRRWRRFHR